MISLIFVILPSLAILAGSLLVWGGMRGRRTDNHPLCRRCGFDLHGLPADSKVCSECGADLRGGRSIRIGNRTRRPALVGGGLLLIVPTTLLLLGSGYILVRHVDLTPHEPTWLLTRLAFSNSAPTQAKALAELTVRVQAGRMSQTQIDEMVDRVLSAQADRAAPWSAAWGDWATNARTCGRVSEARWQRYVAQGIDVKLIVRPRARRSDPIPVFLENGSPRLASRQEFIVTIDYQKWELNGIPRRGEFFTLFGVSGNYGPQGAWQGSPSNNNKLFFINPRWLVGVPDGPQELHLSADASLNEMPVGLGLKTICQKHVELRASWMLLPLETPSVILQDDPLTRAALNAGLGVRAVVRYASVGPQPFFAVSNLPVDVAFEVWAQRPGKEEPWLLGRMVRSSGDWEPLFDPKAKAVPVGERVDLIFRPDPARVSGTIGILRIFGGTLRVRGVPVQDWSNTIGALPVLYPTTNPSDDATSSQGH